MVVDCHLMTTAKLVVGRQPRFAHLWIQRFVRQDFAAESMIDNNSATVCLHLAGCGVLARSGSSARSIALSKVCQSVAARGFNAASASSHCVSRSLMRVLAPARSPLSSRAETSMTMVRKGVRSPSFDDIAASASETNEIGSFVCRRGSLVDTVRTPTASAKVILFMPSLLVVHPRDRVGFWWTLRLEIIAPDRPCPRGRLQKLPK